MLNSFSDKNLLIVSLGYPCKEIQLSSFVKSQVDILKQSFKTVYIISPIPYFPKFLGKLSIIPTLYRNFSLMGNYTYDNVSVYYPRYFTLPIEFFRKRNTTLAAKASIRCMVKNNIKPDICHAHFIWPSGYVASKIKTKFGCPYVVTGHGFDIYSLPNKSLFWKNLTLNILSDSDAVISVSESSKKHLISLGYKGKIVKIPNGFNSEIFFPIDRVLARHKLDLPLDDKVILTVGNLVDIKNHKTLIKAVIELRKRISNATLYIIGGGDLKGDLQNLIDESEATGFIKLIGPKPHDEIPVWMNAADVFALPSYSESFGIVNIEALACGIPVVTTVNGGSEEIIVNPDLGIIQNDPNDFKLMSENLVNALTKTWDRNIMVSYSQKFTWENACNQILNLYSEYLK